MRVLLLPGLSLYLCLLVSLVQVSGQMKAVWEREYDLGELETPERILRCGDGGYHVAT